MDESIKEFKDDQPLPKLNLGPPPERFQAFKKTPSEELALESFNHIKKLEKLMEKSKNKKPITENLTKNKELFLSEFEVDHYGGFEEEETDQSLWIETQEINTLLNQLNLEEEQKIMEGKLEKYNINFSEHSSQSEHSEDDF